MKCIVIGGGIIGLSSAYFLQQSGWEVTVIDKGDFSNNCSYGNAGYVCPSHFVPMATPGIVKQGLKWMLDPESPFYVKPRLSMDLVNWGLKFVRSANAAHVERSAIPLRDIAILSKRAYEAWFSQTGLDAGYEEKGLLDIFQLPQNEAHAHHTVEKAQELGLDAVYLDAAQVQAMEPQTELNIHGAVYFKCDAHLYPNKLMHSLLEYLHEKQVRFVPGETVTGFERQHGRISRVKTSKAVYDCDTVVIATGSWSREMAALLDVDLPMAAGRGYSVTYENAPYTLNHPAILMEGRVAITPMDGNKIRFGGTMEITSLNAPPNMNRVKGILKTVQRYIPAYNIPMPPKEQIWFGYRPCSADGLPYIGRLRKTENCILATGHSMLGLSLGAGTGKLVCELANEQPTSMDIKPFSPERF
ncbi:FAD-binding oxidoreductase [Chitinophaga sp. XS-30]|uniref:NAD(P)/FAD-dependent oxidoreductase n=1 Tax=Chitinophaga sp. XS-30 TaxID=2604421 RepID=UPI0011DCF18E|nr:FAD-dependent oxidoreductase [Chitinophaga sp. XS-30]QEH43077.1 FAD-binding oxidoreductase [Chitinophaga sp. XS-30]